LCWAVEGWGVVEKELSQLEMVLIS
jgi:hypothetical protein